jgi:hypothetical protein
VSVSASDGKYYYLINDYDEIYQERTYVSTEMISNRITELVAVLQREEITPLLITICRSRFSGFTPEDQWQFIETQLCSQLSKIYPLDPVSLSQL